MAVAITAAQASVAQEFLKRVARRCFAGILRSDPCPNAPGKFEILAEIRHVLFLHRVSAAFAALMGDAGVVVNTIQAYLQVRAATMARFRPTGLRAECPFPAASMAMASHALTVTWSWGCLKRKTAVRRPVACFGRGR